MIQISIQAKIIGRRGPAVQPILFQASTSIQSLRQLLEALVQQQIADFQSRKQEAKFLRVLTEAQLVEGAESGRIRMGDPDREERIPDYQHSLEAVITAFADGLFYVFLDDVQLENLDGAIQLQEGSNALFVRLIPLAGG